MSNVNPEDCPYPALSVRGPIIQRLAEIGSERTGLTVDEYLGSLVMKDADLDVLAAEGVSRSAVEGIAELQASQVEITRLRQHVANLRKLLSETPAVKS